MGGEGNSVRMARKVAEHNMSDRQCYELSCEEMDSGCRRLC